MRAKGSVGQKRQSADDCPIASPETIADNRAAIEKHKALHGDRIRPPRLRVREDAGVPRVGSLYADDKDGFVARLGLALGSDDPAFLNVLLSQLIDVPGKPADGGELPNDKIESRLEMAIGFMRGVDPQNEVEGALGAQMYSMHLLSMNMASRAASANSLEACQAYGAMAVKLSRTFAAQTEALAKLRSKGRQVVTVIHEDRRTYVAPGAQAIVGDVHQHRAGGGGSDETGRQSLACDLADLAGLPYVPGVEMPCSDQARDALPIASGKGTSALSHARWDEPRRSKRPGER